MKAKLIIVAMLLICSIALGGWESVTSPVTTNLLSIFSLDEGNLYISGSDGTICHYDYTDWTVETPITENNLKAIYMHSETDGWAAGTEGTILRCEAGVWSIFPTEDEQRAYNDIIAFAEDDVYFIGYSLLDGSVLEHWDGTALSAMHTFAENMIDLEGSGPDDLWVAGGNSAIFHYDGTSWDSSYSSFAEDVKIFSLTINDDNNPVVTGVRLPGWDIDMVLEHTPDSGWTTLWQGYTKRIMACSINEKRGFAMGNSGRLIEYSIFGWSELDALGSRQLNDVCLLDMSQGWAISDGGNIYRYTESAINVDIEDNMLVPGDTLNVDVTLMNPGPEVSNIMEIIMMEIYGSFWFWPSWSTEFDCEIITMTAGMNDTTSLFSFVWPSAGAGDISIWGALLDDQGNVLSYDIEPLSWTM